MKILFATDGSDFSKAAIATGCCQIANPQDAQIKIINAVGPPIPFATDPFALSAESYNEIEQFGRLQARRFVEQAEAQIRAIFPEALLDLTIQVFTETPQRAIVETAREWGADLIVIGSHGYGFWSRALLGSVSSAVVHHAHCSVLVVRTAKETDTSD